MDDSQQQGSGQGGVPPAEGHTFAAAYYSQLLAAAAAAPVEPNNEPEQLSPGWTPYSGLQGDLPHGSDAGFSTWSLADDLDFQNYAADTYAASGQLPCAADFTQGLDYLRTLGHQEVNTAEPSLNQQFATDLNVPMHFMQASDHGRELYSETFQQIASEEPSSSEPTSPFSGKTYDPFGTREVFPTVDTFVQAQSKTPEPLPKETTTKSRQPTKPSYSEVAKQKLSSSSSSSTSETPVQKKEPAVKESASAHNPSISSTGSTAKSKKTKSGASRSHSVPVVPSAIHPESRYGLDTFDDPFAAKRQCSWSSQSGDSSRKGSCSSEEVLLERPPSVNVYDMQGPGPGTGSKYHSQFGDIAQESHIKPDRKPPKAPEKKAKSASKNKPFFDPKRIFSEKEKKPDPSAKSFIPNNQQNFHFDEADAVLNNGKTKSNWKTSSAKYINNDLRDSKKQTNTESRNYGGVYDHYDDDFPQPAASQGKRDVSSGTSKRSSATMTDHDSREQQQQQQPRKVKREYPDFKKITAFFGVWLTFIWEWIVWAVKAALVLGLKFAKLLLSVALLILLVAWYYINRLFWKCWNFVTTKIPFLHRWAPQADGYDDRPNNAFHAKTRLVGLKENIVLPTTGDEAMKRLLSCKGKDPYSILGLKVEATDEDIKRYYRRQAILVHPDKNQQPGAEEAFKILGHAIELIGEPDARREYDSQRTEAQEQEAAMGQFTDLLTKLHEKMEEAANMMRCDNCGGKHKRILVDRPAYSARFCSRCNIRHPAKECDVWAESSVLGFYWHYYACMEGRVYDITQWASCQHESFKCLKANDHHVVYRISTGAGNRHRNNSARASDDLEDFLSNLFHQPQPGAARQGSGDTGQGGGKKATWNQSAGGGGKKGGGRKKKKKH